MIEKMTRKEISQLVKELKDYKYSEIMTKEEITDILVESFARFQNGIYDPSVRLANAILECADIKFNNLKLGSKGLMRYKFIPTEIYDEYCNYCKELAELIEKTI